ncbi:MAG: sulfotransferase domain-containing protein, partial [Pseudomonadota bacterium]
MKAVMAPFVSEEGWARGLAFEPRASDVIITPFAKCGTTWMQQIVHGLRSNGDMSFGEISGVVPWIELAHDMQIDLEAPQAGDLRAYKSHLGWHQVPKGARYIVVLRDPLDAMVSMYRFFEDWFFVAGRVSVDDFAQYYLDRSDERDYWSHAMSWWNVRDREDVLILAYEHMKQDLPGAVQGVARFIGVTEPSVIARATDQAQYGFMKAHGAQFDDHLTRLARDPACGLPPDSQTSKLGRGAAGQGRAE